MDINQYLSSSIIPRENDLCFVQFPTFTGYTEVVIYKHRDINISYGIHELFPRFRCEEVYLDIHRVILASRVLGYIAVRIIDTDAIYGERIFLIMSGEVFTFELMGKGYFALVYTDMAWEYQYHTNIPSGGLFVWNLGNHTFTVVNTLTATVVFEKECILMPREHIKKPDEIHIDESQSCVFIPDPLFEDTGLFFRNFLANIPVDTLAITDSGTSMRLDASKLERREFLKLIGFLGVYTCILSEWLAEYPGYLQLSEVTDGRFTLPDTFSVSEMISCIDPRWHQARLALLEILYLAGTLEASKKNLEKWMQEIDNLGNPHILLEKKRLESNLHAMEEMYPRYLAQKDTLIALLKHKIS